jgi:hypothetical protein
MMMIAVVLTAVVLLGQAAPAAATADPAAKPPAGAVSGVTVTSKAQETQAQADAKADTVTCHSEQVIGSLFPKKVCSTRRQQADRRAADKEVARDFERSAIGGAQPH